MSYLLMEGKNLFVHIHLKISNNTHTLLLPSFRDATFMCCLAQRGSVERGEEEDGGGEAKRENNIKQ